jgi:ABC-type glutathione transport system ATPase component
MKAMRRRMQIIFQDPYASLNPRRTVAEIVGLPLQLHGLAKRAASCATRSAPCSSAWGSRPTSSTATRTSSRAGSASASASPGR